MLSPVPALAKSGAAAELVHAGNVADGLEAYAQRNDWEACLQLAAQQGPHMLVKYATLHGAYLIQNEQLELTKLQEITRFCMMNISCRWLRCYDIHFQ